MVLDGGARCPWALRSFPPGSWAAVVRPHPCCLPKHLGCVVGPAYGRIALR